MLEQLSNENCLLNTLQLAPWVVKNQDLLLGLKLTVVRVSHLNLNQIPLDKISYLQENNFLIQTDTITNNNVQTCLQKANGSEYLNWVWITAPEFLEPANKLIHCLSKLNPNLNWEITYDKQIILENITSSPSIKPIIIRLAHQEPISKSSYTEIFSEFIGRASIVWIGETMEGAHIGPFIHSENDLNNYFKATKEWYFSQILLEAGFTEYWPSSIYPALIESPQMVAEAVLQVTKSNPGTCILLPKNQTVSLWTTLLNNVTTAKDFFDQQFWSKGLIRNFKVNNLDLLKEAYITTCRTPCGAKEALEGNSGKGENLTKSTNTLVGESVERFSAWQSNQSLQHLRVITPPKSSILYDIHQFHPFGETWENYLNNEHPALPWYPVRDEINIDNQSFIPECLVPFPYNPTDSEYIATRSSTSGLAAHTSYKKAVIKGALELFERNDLYLNFLFQIPGSNLDFSILPSDSMVDDWLRFSQMLESLQENQINYWFIIYHPTSTLPIVQCFLQDKKEILLSRGTGSGYTLHEAVVGSLFEALQIREQLLKTIKKNRGALEDTWTHPEVISKISAYLNQSNSLPVLDYPGLSLSYIDDSLFEEIKQRLRELKKPLLVANLPCPILNWSAVRVLIPGFTTHQNASQSAGGSRLLNKTFKYRVPT